MMTINLVCVGNLKEKFWVDAQNEYIKRLQKFCKFNVIEVDEKNLASNDNECKQKEGKLILEKCKGNMFLFDLNGKNYSSEEFALLIEKQAQFSSTLTFVIGGSYGVSEEVKSQAKGLLSFGKQTLPHNLARVVAIEQIYRAFNIIAGTAYHK